jgi:glyoxalase family protein
MACFKFIPPEGHTVADVLSLAHRFRVERGHHAIADSHIADAIADLMEQRTRIST